jgi:predicted deacylase
MMKNSFTVCNQIIHPGDKMSIKLPSPELYTYTPIDIPVNIINSKKPGPRLFVCGAIHGDEISGVEIIRRLLKLSVLNKLKKGTLIAVPIVNMYGFIYQSRYLPDRRDLNRNFPGHKTGSLTSRLAKLFMDEIVHQCTHGIDLHSGTIHRRNLPQIRVNLEQTGTRKLAKAFNAPVILSANLRDGSLRRAASEMGIPVLVYEGGEALRFNEIAIRTGVRGILNVMKELGMIEKTISDKKLKNFHPITVRSSIWIRAPRSGILHNFKSLGKKVEKGEYIGIIVDPFGSEEIDIISPRAGIIIGHTNIPLINEGEALFHIACFKKLKGSKSTIDNLKDLSLIYEDPAMH